MSKITHTVPDIMDAIYRSFKPGTPLFTYTQYRLVADKVRELIDVENNMTAFSVSDARYSKGRKVLRVFDNTEGMKGRCAFLAEALGGKWVHRSKGYSMSAAAVLKFNILYEKGFHGHMRVIKGEKALFYHRERNLDDLSLSQALKLAKKVVQ
jgi:hypothetical protein